MDRRTFLVISLTGISVLAVEIGSQASAESLDSYVRVLQRIFAPELISSKITQALQNPANPILAMLGINDKSVLTLVTRADEISQVKFNKPFSNLRNPSKDTVIDDLMSDQIHYKTYQGLRIILFADPTYGIDPHGSVWQRIGYKSFDYTPPDAWQ